MKLPLFIISDTHFKIDNSNNENKKRALLFSLFKKIESTGGTLIIGGDFFDFWFDFKITPPNYYLSILKKIKDLESKGIQIHYIAGNHDYWDFGTLKKFGITFYKEDFNFTIQNKQIKILHGDGILESDKKYRLLSYIIRHPIFIKLFSLLGQKNAYDIGKLVSFISGKFHNNELSKKRLLKKKLLNHIKNKFYDTYDIILIGHYHLTDITETNKKTTIFLGSWVENNTITIFDGKKWIQNDLIDGL